VPSGFLGAVADLDATNIDKATLALTYDGVSSGKLTGTPASNSYTITVGKNASTTNPGYMGGGVSDGALSNSTISIDQGAVSISATALNIATADFTRSEETNSYVFTASDNVTAALSITEGYVKPSESNVASNNNELETAVSATLEIPKLQIGISSGSAINLQQSVSNNITTV